MVATDRPRLFALRVVREAADLQAISVRDHRGPRSPGPSMLRYLVFELQGR
jgi:hypothetical protein